jgi:hypothetical protein
MKLIYFASSSCPALIFHERDGSKSVSLASTAMGEADTWLPVRQMRDTVGEDGVGRLRPHSTANQGAVSGKK